MSATGFHPEPSAKAPWTRTMVLTSAYAAVHGISAAPKISAATRRFIRQICQYSMGRMFKSPVVGATSYDGLDSRSITAKQNSLIRYDDVAHTSELIVILGPIRTVR